MAARKISRPSGIRNGVVALSLFNNDEVRDGSVGRVASELIVIGRFSGPNDGRRVVEELVIRNPDYSGGIHPDDVVGKGAIDHVDLTAGVSPHRAVAAYPSAKVRIPNRQERVRGRVDPIRFLHEAAMFNLSAHKTH